MRQNADPRLMGTIVVLVAAVLFGLVTASTWAASEWPPRGSDEEAAGAVAPEEPQAEQIVLTIDPADCAMDRPIVSDGLPEGCRVRLKGEDLPADDLALRVAELYGVSRPIGADSMIGLVRLMLKFEAA